MAERIAVAVLEVMWDWRAKTSSAGYTEEAPRYYLINPHNFTGGRLYDWIGKRGEYYDELWTTNACPQLVSSASGRGTPDPNWLSENLRQIALEGEPSLILVCGKVAQATFSKAEISTEARILFLPHPAARTWTKESLAYARRLIREGTQNLHLTLRRDGRLIVTKLGEITVA